MFSEGHGLVLQGHVPCRNFATVGYRFPPGPPPGIAKCGQLRLIKMRSLKEKEIASWRGKSFHADKNKGDESAEYWEPVRERLLQYSYRG